MRSLDIKHSQVFKKNYEAFTQPEIRFIINQGGSRSSKTWSICQLIVWYALTNARKSISIARKTSPALYASVYVDFVSILNDLDLYDLVKHNKTQGTFGFPNGTHVKFFSIDDQQKLRGRKHDLVFLNEANEITYEEFTQINMRTTGKIILDWNPSDPHSWLLDLEKFDNSTLIHSTYKDNPFLESAIVREIENLINLDDHYYQIYALGMLPLAREVVFSKWDVEPFPHDVQWVYGMDFGFNDPTALVQVGLRDGTIWAKEVLYESYLDPDLLLKRFRELDVRKDVEIYCDSSRPDLIQHLNSHGYTALKSNKAIKEGLDFIRMHKIRVDPTSANIQKELKTYAYKKIRGTVTDTPVDFNNHSIDAWRYASMSFKSEFSISFAVGH